jgi:hypothetical protein
MDRARRVSTTDPVTFATTMIAPFANTAEPTASGIPRGGSQIDNGATPAVVSIPAPGTPPAITSHFGGSIRLFNPAVQWRRSK